MYPILYGNTTKKLTELVADTKSVGIGELVEAREVICTRTANGVYELDFEYPVTGRLYSELHIGGVIKSKFTTGPTKTKKYVNGVYVNDPLQIFDIVHISEPMMGWISVHCEHCSYRLNKQIHEPYSYNGEKWTKKIGTHILGGTEFVFTTTRGEITYLKVIHPEPVRKVLMGSEGSLLDRNGSGVFWFSNNAVVFYADADFCADNGITLEYGVDLLDYTVEASVEDQYDAIVGYYEQDGTVVHSGLVYVDGEVEYPRTLVVDFTSDYDSETVPTAAELATRATTYATNNKINEPKITFDVQFVNLPSTTAGKTALNSEDMQIDLYDYVRVVNMDRGIDLKARVTKTEYDVLLERFRSIEVGTRQQSLAKVIKSAIAKV